MKKFIPVSISLLIMLGFSYHLSAQTAPQLNKSNVKQIVAAMTLEEKAKLVTGMGFRMPGMNNNHNQKDTAKKIFELPAMETSDANTPEKVPGAAGRTHAIKRLGIPSITVSDGPAGVRINPIRDNDSSKTYYATAFPVATLLASSWDTSLVKKVGTAFGSEVRDYGIDVLLAPGMNIQHNPLGGRNFEYYSEDPLVSGSIAAAFVNGIQSNGVGVSVKHFIGNNQETNRNSINTIVSERAFREIYLKNFEIAIKKSHPWTVMSSYNKINGTYTSQERELLTTILRDEWNFKGTVMTDWFGGKDPVAQMQAGNDLLMPGTPKQTEAIIDAVKNGKLDVKYLDENVERILNLILLSPTFKGYKYSDKPDLKKDAAVTRMAAAEGMVLLKDNDNTLPLKSVKKIALFGNTSYDIIAGGTGSGNVNKAYTISLNDGLINAGYTLNATLTNNYKTYVNDAKSKQKPTNFFMLPPPIPEMNIDPTTMQQLANDNDVAILTIGRNAGEGADRKIDNDYYLSDAEKSLINQVAAAFHAKNKKLIVILNVGGVTDVTAWKDNADAILLAWQPGLEAGNSIADIISGKVNPSGKLATTFPMKYEDVPSAKSFPGKVLDSSAQSNPMMGKPSEVVYEEGVYVGYRYYNTFNIQPAYEFGYGLSYTTFNYSKIKLSSNIFNNSLTATINITNTGKVAGKEVVELYLTAPAVTEDKPAEELKGFAKTKLLKPNESQTITFTIHADDLASFDTNSSSWIADAGTYKIKIGSSSINIKQTADFTVENKLKVETVDKVLVPQTNINELHSTRPAETGFIYDLNGFSAVSR